MEMMKTEWQMQKERRISGLITYFLFFCFFYFFLYYYWNELFTDLK